MKLEKALEVMGDADGPAVECLKESWRKLGMRRSGDPPRRSKRISEKRISELDAERLSEMKALDEAKERLVRLEAEQAEVPKVSSVQEAVPPVDWAAEVQRLREELTRVREGRSPILVAHSCQSSSEAASWLQERAAKRRAGVAESVPTESTRCGTVVVRKTSGAPRCHRVWGQRVDSGVDGSDAARCSAVPQFAFHSEQHGCVRIVAHQCGWLGCRVGEAANPGPTSRRRRMRALPWSWDSDTESDDEGRNVVRRLESHVDSDEEPLLPPSSPPEEVIRALEADLCSPPRATRRVMLIPQSQGGTLSSIQDARETLLSEADLPSTFPASSRAVRRLVLVSNSQEDRSTVPSMDMAYNSARSPQEAPGRCRRFVVRHSDCGRNV